MEDKVSKIIERKGFAKYGFLQPWEVTISHWIRIKCRFGCPSYGKCLACPPNTPSIEDCKNFFSEYSSAYMIHYEVNESAPEKRTNILRDVNNRLLELENEVYRMGYHKAFVMFIGPCNFCKKCTGDYPCQHPVQRRPSLQGMGVDFYKTAVTIGLPIDEEITNDWIVNRYGMLLVE